MVLGVAALRLPAASVPGLWLAAATVGGAGLAACVLWLRAAPRRAFQCQAAGQLAALLLLAFGILPGWETARLARPLAAELASRANGPIAAYGEYEPSMAYYSGRAIQPLKSGAGQLPGVRCVATDEELAPLQAAGRWTLERTFRGWHKNHAETVHVLRRDEAWADRATITARR